MSTKSLSNYKDELKVIADRHGFSGTVTDFLINILSYSIYENQFNIMVASNEVDPEKAMNINSVIDYAISKMYSVFRGQNPMINFRVKSKVFKSIAKYDQLCSGKGWNVYSLDEIPEINIGQEVVIRGIVAKSLIKKEITPSDEMETYYIDFHETDVSSHFLLEATESATFEEVKTTKSILKMVDEKLPMEMTSYDYGIRFYFSSTKEDRVQMSYRLSYFPLFSKDIDMEDIKKLKINGLDIEDTSFLGHIAKEGLNDGIGVKARLSSHADGSIKSNSDILSVFNELFQSKVKSSTILMTGVDHENSTQGNIIVYYAPKDPDNLIRSTELNSFYDAMTPYIPCKTVVNSDNTSSEVAVKPLLIVVADKVLFNAKITVFTKSSVSRESIYNIMNSNEYKVGLHVSIYQILADINAVSGVAYAMIQVESSGVLLEEINMPPDKYLSWSDINLEIKSSR